MASVVTTKYVFVSNALPGPTRKSRRWWLPLMAVTIRIALGFFALSRPWGTDEIAKSLMTSPPSRFRSPIRYCWCGGWSGRWATAGATDSSVVAAATIAMQRDIGVLLVRGRGRQAVRRSSRRAIMDIEYVQSQYTTAMKR